MTSEPSETGPNGDPDRDSAGKFRHGNRAGKGNPHAKKVQKLRAALIDAVETEHIVAVVNKLIVEATKGDHAAAKIVLDRVFGPPVPLDWVEEIEALRADLEALKSRRR